MNERKPGYIAKRLIDQAFGLDFYEEYFASDQKERTFRVKISGSHSEYSADLNFEEAKTLVVALASQFTQDEIIDCLHDALKNAQS